MIGEERTMKLIDNYTATFDGKASNEAFKEAVLNCEILRDDGVTIKGILGESKSLLLFV